MLAARIDALKIVSGSVRPILLKTVGFSDRLNSGTATTEEPTYRIEWFFSPSVTFAALCEIAWICTANCLGPEHPIAFSLNSYCITCTLGDQGVVWGSTEFGKAHSLIVRRLPGMF